MAYTPDDDRFYSSLSKGSADYQKYRDKMAEDQAATTRQIGAMYGKALPDTVNAAMQGASWRMKREGDQQRMDLDQAKEGRDVQKFAEDQQDREDAKAAAQASSAYEQAPAEETYATGAGVDYVPGMTHQDVKRMAQAREMGFKDRDLTQKGEIAGSTLQGENARSAATIAAENTRAGNTLAAENTRQGNTLAFDREKLAQEKALETNKLASGKQAPAELVSKIGEAESAQKALEHLGAEWQAKGNGKFGAISQFVPNTDASRYDDAAQLNAQIVGKFLEEGKMTDADVPRYKAMLPTPTDSPARAAEKLTRMSEMIAQKKAAHVQALQGAGYNVGPVDATGQGHKFSFDKKSANDGKTAIGAPGGPKEGDVEDGHVFLGGDPASPSSWRPVQ